MKKKLNAPLLAVFFATMTITACTRKLAVQSTPSTDAAVFAQTNKALSNPIPINNINAKVLRSFHDSYGEVPDTKWFKADDGFGVMFKHNRMSKTIYYKLNGSVDAEIFYYSEDQLPRQERDLVKSHFYDYAITYVTEVHKNGATAFYVKVEDASNIKTIKIVEEEWEVTENLVKK
jgi:hypothetical protein